jgi:transposase InsO family protein
MGKRSRIIPECDYAIIEGPFGDDGHYLVNRNPVPADRLEEILAFYNAEHKRSALNDR